MRRQGRWIGGLSALLVAALVLDALVRPRSGLEVRYFDPRAPSEPLAVRDEAPPHERGFDGPADAHLPPRFRAVWAGWLHAEHAGRYFFRAVGNGWTEVQLAGDAGAAEPLEELAWYVDLPAGLHPLRVVHEADRAAHGAPRLTLGWSKELYHPRPIPREAVFASPSAPERLAASRVLRAAIAVLALGLLAAIAARLLGPERARRLGLRLAVSAAALGALALLAELGLRAAGIEPREYVPGDVWALRYTLDQPGTTTLYLGWLPYNVKEFEVPVTINARGWRDREHALEKPEGTLRVAVVGDSYVEAKEVRLEDTFARRLERALNEAGGAEARRFEVLAFGRGGTSTEDHLRTLAEDVLPFAPDLVVLACFPGNDVREDSAELTRAFDEWAGRVLHDRVLAAKVAFLDRWTWLDGSVLNRVLADRALELYVERLHWFEDGLSREDLVSIEAEVYARGPYDERWAAAWRETKDHLLAARALVADAGAELLVLVVRAHQLPGASLEQAGGEERYDLSRPAREVVAFCEEQGIPCLDLGPAFERFRAATDERTSWRHDGHWNENGHRVAAEALLERLAEHLGLR